MLPLATMMAVTVAETMSRLPTAPNANAWILIIQLLPLKPLVMTITAVVLTGQEKDTVPKPMSRS